MMIKWALELIQKPGFCIVESQSQPSKILTFTTKEDAEDYRWTRDALVVMATRVARTAIQEQM